MNPAVDRYWRNWPKLANTRSRHEKAAKILAVLRSYSQRDLSDLTCLDIGCGSGIISASLAPHFARLVASDLDVDGIVFAHLEYPGTNILHMVSDARFVALADNSCDVIVCSHVYE